MGAKSVQDRARGYSAHPVAYHAVGLRGGDTLEHGEEGVGWGQALQPP